MDYRTLKIEFKDGAEYTYTANHNWEDWDLVNRFVVVKDKDGNNIEPEKTFQVTVPDIYRAFDELALKIVKSKGFCLDFNKLTSKKSSKLIILLAIFLREITCFFSKRIESFLK